MEEFAFMNYIPFAQHARQNRREELATLFEKMALIERPEHVSDEFEHSRQTELHFGNNRLTSEMSSRSTSLL
jgi:rubrerythrin